MKLTGRLRSSSSAGPRQPGKVAGGDHLGEHHGGGFQRLDLVVAVLPLGAVLHDQDAERAAGAQHRHAEEGAVDLLAGFRQVGEGRMLLGVRQVERARAGGDGADETLAEPQLRKMDRSGVQTLGSVELEHGVGAQHIERAHLGHHVLGDVVHDPVEPLLRLKRLRHELAEPLQQDARASGHVTHKASSPAARPERPART